MSLPFLTKYQQVLTDIAIANDVSYLALFGSYARGQEKPDSDVDLLVEFEKKKGLLDLVGLEQYIAQKLGKKVDLVTRQGLSKYIKPYIQDDLHVIYAKKS